MEKPFSPACENNQLPILQVLRRALNNCHRVLELASGTGQHAVFFSSQLPHLEWQPSDLPAAHPGIHAWRDEADLPNLLAPLTLDVSTPAWSALGVDGVGVDGVGVDGVFAANLLHFVPWHAVENLLARVAELLRPHEPFCVYGPFNYNGLFTSESNRRFDAWLKTTDPRRGIRDFAQVEKLANRNGLTLVADIGMPANNRLLWWKAAADKAA